MKHWIASLLLFVCSTNVSHGAEECPFIRPVGLTAAEVDQIVVDGAQRHIGRQLGSGYRDKTFKLLLNDNPIIEYSMTTLYVSEMLGYDLIKKNWDAAEKRGGRPENVLTIADMQALAREAYFAGRDSEYPPAGSAQYQLQGILVGSPKPTSGWTLTRCGSEVGVWFRKVHPNQSGASTATVSIVDLPAPTTDAQFLSFVRSYLGRTLPPGVSVDSPGAQIAFGTRVPCADFAASGSTANRPYKLRGRVCYGGIKTNPRLGYIALYATSGSLSAEFDQSSRDFIAVADPSR